MFKLPIKYVKKKLPCFCWYSVSTRHLIACSIQLHTYSIDSCMNSQGISTLVLYFGFPLLPRTSDVLVHMQHASLKFSAILHTDRPLVDVIGLPHWQHVVRWLWALSALASLMQLLLTKTEQTKLARSSCWGFITELLTLNLSSNQ